MKKFKILSFFTTLLVSVILPFLPISVYAAENDPYYVNNNGIEMSEENYNMLSNFYSNNAIANMSLEKYQAEMSHQYTLYGSETKYIKTSTLLDSTGKVLESNSSEVSESQYNNHVVPLFLCGTGHQCWETDYKQVDLNVWSYVDDPNAIRLVLVNTWKIMPAVRSYDVIAMRYTGATATTAWGDQSYFGTNTPVTTIEYSYNGTNMKVLSNGIGISQNLVGYTDLNYLTNRIVIEGTTDWSNFAVWGSYQHAVSNVTLAQSKNYTLSSSGLGGVINFNSSVVGYYDGMQGVYWPN